VTCRERSGENHLGYVLIGPRRPVPALEYTFLERLQERWYGVLTWRWQEYPEVSKGQDSGSHSG
jgi:hypothetical protein